MSENIELAPVVPTIPEEAVEFARAVGKLAEQYGLASVAMNIAVDTGYYSKYGDRLRAGESIAEKLKVSVSRKDGRGRPRTKIFVEAEISVCIPVVDEPDSMS